MLLGCLKTVGTPSLCYLPHPQFYHLCGLAPMSCCVVLMVNAFSPNFIFFHCSSSAGKNPHFSFFLFRHLCLPAWACGCLLYSLPSAPWVFSVPSLFLFVNSFPNTGKSSSHHLQNFYLFDPKAQNKVGSEVQILGILLVFAAYEVLCPSKVYLFVSFTDKIVFFYSTFLPKA